MTDIWEEAKQAFWRTDRGEYGHDDDKKIIRALTRGRKLEEALKEVLVILESPVVLPAGHSGDEETGQHYDDCERCLVLVAIERSRAALALDEIHPLPPGFILPEIPTRTPPVDPELLELDGEKKEG